MGLFSVGGCRKRDVTVPGRLRRRYDARCLAPQTAEGEGVTQKDPGFFYVVRGRVDNGNGLPVNASVDDVFGGEDGVG